MKTLQILVATALVACAPVTPVAPKKPVTNLAKDRVFSAPIEKVWGAAIKGFSETPFEPEIVDSAGGVIKAKTSYVIGEFFGPGTRLDHWPKKYEAEYASAPREYVKGYAQCPIGWMTPFAIENLSIYVNEESAMQTRVIVKYQIQVFSTLTGKKNCQSLGTMEAEILEAIASNLSQ